MKKMKNYSLKNKGLKNHGVMAKIISVLLLCITSNNGYALFRQKGAVQYEAGKKATTGTSWNFELYNKTNKNVFFSLINENKSIIGPIQVSKAGKVRAEVDGSSTLYIKIWTKIDPTKKGFLQKAPDPDIYRALRANGRTMFLTLDEKGLRPQTGAIWGLTGKTDSGLDNSNNINFFSIQNVVKVRD